MKHLRSCLLHFLVLILIPLPVFASDVKTKSAFTQNGIVHVKIDASDQGQVISPLLFGHNLEHTRKAIWQGISAEMIANRKFAAVENGLPKHWTILISGGKVVTDGQLTYSGKNSVLLENGGAIGQQNDWLAFQKKIKYSFRIRTKSKTSQTLIIRILDSGKGHVIFERKLVSNPGDWQLLSGEFVANFTLSNGQIQLVSQAGGSIRIGAVSLMPANNFQGMRRDVVDLLKQLKPGSLRWPGGCYAEFYHWQDGLLPVDQRPPVGPTGLSFLLPATDDYDSQEIGIDEFIALCREVGSEPAITMRLSDNTPKDAAAWVEYCNGAPDTQWGKIRAQRGHLLPYQVKCWFVGNELYSFGRGGLKDAEFCAVQTRLFARAMKKSDPTIQLVGCTHFGKGDWNRKMIGEAGELVETFSVHDYLLDRYKGDISGIAKSPTMSLRPLLENARAALQSEFPEDHNFTLAFDEWNTRWGLSGSVSMGLYTAGVLNLLCREASSMQIERAYYFMPVNEGAIKVMPLGSELDPSGELFALYAPHQGNRLLNIPVKAADADLDLCASIAPDMKHIYVTVVNRNATSDQLLELAVDNFKGPKEATLKLLFPQPDDADARFFQHNEKLKIVDRNGVLLKIPPYGIARVHLGIQKKSEGRPPKAQTTKII